ncbi:MAG: hypothetical protein ACRCWG_03770 [Sarcina sp.]
MKKKFLFISIIGSLLLFGGCNVQDSSIKREEVTGKINLDVEFEELEDKIGLEKIESYDRLSNLSLQVLDEGFLRQREKKLHPELINEEIVLQCSDRAVQIANLSSEEEKLFSVEFVSQIDRINYKMDRSLILNLINKLYSFGSFDELLLREKDSEDLLINHYIVTTLQEAISYNEDFSDEERLTILMILSDFEALNYYASSLGAYANSALTDEDSKMILDDIKISYEEGFEKFKEILPENQ